MPGLVPEGATVTLHYSQSLEGGSSHSFCFKDIAGAGQDEPFDSSVLRGKQERYKLGEGQLIEGLEVKICYTDLFYSDCLGRDQDNDQERESTVHD